MLVPALLIAVAQATTPPVASLERSLALHREGRPDEVEARVVELDNRTEIALGAGRYGQVLDLLTEAETLLDTRRAEPWVAEQRRRLSVNRAVAYERLGAHREALAVLDAVAGGETDAGRAAQIAVHRGVLLRNLGDAAAAERAFAAAIGELERLGDRAALANAWVNAGLAAQLERREPARAEAAFRRALELTGAGGDRPGEIQARYFLGRLLVDLGRPEEARAVLGRAREIAEASGDAEGTWMTLEGLARLERAAGRDAAASALLERALATIESLRAGIRERPLRAGFFGDKRAIYALAVDLAAERAVRSGRSGDVLTALAIAQRAKARELLDAVGGGLAPLTAERLAELVDRETTLLEFFAGERTLWRWRLGQGRVEVAAAAPAPSLLAAVGEAHAALARGGEPSPATVEELSARLLAGLEGLRGAVAVAADARLRYLPFEMLRLPDGYLLVERAAVRYLPSASWLARPKASGTAPRWELAGLAGAVVDPATLRGVAGLLAARFALPSLPGGERELAVAARALGGRSRLLVGAAATEAGWRELAAEGAHVLHLATHAVIDERLEPGSALFLSPGGGDDGLLAASEISATNLSADLVVLSGCRTALGSALDGRAFSTLSGAFLAAGARGVVASLWEVGDEATAVFMEQFYFELGDGRTPEEALRRAKVRLRRTPGWEAPRLWAGFVLIGDPPVVVAGRRAWPLVLGAALLLALGGLLGRRRRR
jgi:tetratricopeptide (TPR) repeat protein